VSSLARQFDGMTFSHNDDICIFGFLRFSIFFNSELGKELDAGSGRIVAIHLKPGLGTSIALASVVD
jgi:hypothetical protein